MKQGIAWVILVTDKYQQSKEFYKERSEVYQAPSYPAMGTANCVFC